MAYFFILFRYWVVVTAVVLVSGCNDNQLDELLLKESDIQTSINKQLPINGLVNVQVHIPDEVASLSGFFSERVLSDPMVEAQIELNSVELSLIGSDATQQGRLALLAEPIIRTSLLGVNIAEPLNIELSGGVIAQGDKLYFEPKSFKENGSFFLNNFVPNEYREQFVSNLNDWFVAYFSAYPIYQFAPGEALSRDKIDKMALMIENDMIHFRP